MRNSVLCVHLLDDFSGSAKVFAAAVAVLKRSGRRVHVLVGEHGEYGFIRQQHAVETVAYRFHASKLRLLLSFALVQTRLFLRVLKLLRAGDFDTVYVNTVLPVGAMLAGRLCGKRVITHLHEVGLGSRALFNLLLKGALYSSTRLITVSGYVGEALHLPAARTAVLYNSLATAEWDRAASMASTVLECTNARPFRVLMACSLKWYKGIDAFMALARRCRESGSAASWQIAFTLVLNCEPSEFEQFKTQIAGDTNVEAVHRPSSVFNHYARAHLVVNLSDPAGWIETFGLTLLEAMACGIPVVCPTVGGCTELFEPGEGGWRIDGRETAALFELIERLASDPRAWAIASGAARQAALRFSPELFAERLTRLFTTT